MTKRKLVTEVAEKSSAICSIINQNQADEPPQWSSVVDFAVCELRCAGLMIVEAAGGVLCNSQPPLSSRDALTHSSSPICVQSLPHHHSLLAIFLSV